jgi:hypothetical protein
VSNKEPCRLSVWLIGPGSGRRIPKPLSVQADVGQGVEMITEHASSRRNHSLRRGCLKSTVVVVGCDTRL